MGIYRLRTVALAVVTLVFTGCATITRGTTEVLVVNTDPPGATVEISNGHQCTSPCAVELKRKHDYHVKIAKAGYEPIETDVKSQIVGAGAAGMAGNVLIGGLIGVGVDAYSGATKGLKPNPLTLNLAPAGGSQATEMGMTRDDISRDVGEPDGKSSDEQTLPFGAPYLDETVE